MDQRRLEAAFQDWNRRAMHEVHVWTAAIMSERWARFGLECRILFEKSGVFEQSRFNEIDLSNLDPGLPEGYRKMAKILLGQLDHPELLAVVGDRGKGKTALACGLVKAFCRLGRPAIYRRASEYFADLSGADWQAKEKVRTAYIRPAMLVLDEVQVRDENRQWQDNELTTLIDKRYGDRRATVLIANFKPEALANNLGASVHRRLVEEGGIREANWTGRIHEILAPR